MTPTLLATYIAACILLAVTPGPNMALIIASTLGGGIGAGLATLAGTMSGLSILVAIAALGMTSVMVLMAEWFDVIRWAGAVYLSMLGVRVLWNWWRRREPTPAAAAGPTSAGVARHYLQGLGVSLSNPKVLLFLGAFFPQFVDPAADPGPQLIVLAVLFVAVLAAVDLTYTVIVARARASIDMRRLAVLDVLSGVLLVAGGLVLANVRRP